MGSKVYAALFLSFFVCVLADYLEDTQRKSSTFARECAQEENINYDTILENVRNKDLSSDNYCWAKCWGRKLLMISEAGCFNKTTYEEALSHMPEDQLDSLRKIEETCQKIVVPSSNCDSGKNLFDCLKESVYFQIEMFSS